MDDSEKIGTQIAIGSYIAQAMGDRARAEITIVQPDQRPVPIPHQAPRLPDYFVGRNNELSYLKQLVFENKITLVAVHGMGGIGKSTLVTALAHSIPINQNFPDGVLWVTIGENPDLISILGGFAAAYGYNVQGYVEIEERSKAVRSLLYEKKVLIVLDDAWDIMPINSLLVGGPKSFTIITTRQAMLAKAVRAKFLELDVLSEEESIDLIQGWIGEQMLDSNLDQAKELSKLVEYLPLALELAATQVIDIGWVSVLRRLRSDKQKLSILELDEAQTKRESIRNSFQLSYERLDDKLQENFRKLGIFAYQTPFDIEVVRVLWDLSVENTEVDLNKLSGRALIKRVSETRYQIHGLLHQFIQELMSPQELKIGKFRHAQGYLEFLQQNSKNLERIRLALPNLRLGRDNAIDFLDDWGSPIILKYVRTMHPILYQWGLWKENLEWMQIGINIARNTGDKRTEAYLLKEIGYAYRREANFDLAIESLKQSQILYEELDDLAGLGAVIGNAAIVLMAKGDFDESIVLYHRCLQLHQKSGDQFGIAQALNNLGDIYLGQGQYDRAIEYLEASLKIRKEIGDPFWLSITLANIGAYYRLIGDLDRAMETFIQVKEIRENIGAQDRLAMILQSIGEVYFLRKDYTRALNYINRSIAIHEQLGDWGELILAYNNIGKIYNAQRNYEEALKYYKLGKTIYEEKGGSIKVYSIILSGLSRVYEELGEYKQSLLCIEQAVSIQRKIQYRDLTENLQYMDLLKCRTMA
ncbi:tetratricopeptide repeat protein [Candidatus Dojkabacteria bacterium]|nr:tetratricopeptide repeat protein [Candidatus Dojkabacteria bacterium]